MARVTIGKVIDHIQRWDGDGNGANGDALLVLLLHSLSDHEFVVFNAVRPTTAQTWFWLPVIQRQTGFSPAENMRILRDLVTYGLVKAYVNISGMRLWKMTPNLPILPKTRPEHVPADSEYTPDTP